MQICYPRRKYKARTISLKQSFLGSRFKGPKYILFKKVVLPGRVKCGGTEGEIWWLMAAGREKS